MDGDRGGHDTADFAVDNVARWWDRHGRARYPKASELLVLADSGGSNGARTRAWKYGLQHRLCDRFGLSVTVCHYRSGASKYNPIVIYTGIPGVYEVADEPALSVA